MNRPEDQIIVIFGARGDLAMRKIFPALYSLLVQNILPSRMAVIGTGRGLINSDAYRTEVKEAIEKESAEKDKSRIHDFTENIHYLQADPSEERSYSILSSEIERISAELDLKENVLFYLSVPPELYLPIASGLAACNLSEEKNGWKRIIIEKPFGTDLASAMELNIRIRETWREHQIYRIDHYLGKETIQNILVTRFSNGIFEPLWNRNYIHHVEITSSESIGIEKRGSYYERSGALRDMVQNHLLQLVGFIAMEPPSSIDPNSIRNEIVKVLESLRPVDPDNVHKCAIRGQYTASHIKGEPVKGYREEENVSPDSKTETFAALKFYIDNWRWGGVPFYIRTGKRLPTRVTEAVIHFKETPHYLFSQKEGCTGCNQMIIRIQPDEGILVKFGMKIPGAGFNVKNVNLDFHYSDLSADRIPEPYERLLYDAMNGDSTLYTRADAVMASWRFLDPVIKAWQNDHDIPVYGYPAGTWGPDKTDELIEEPELTWRYPCKNLSDDGIYCEL